jgi:2,4-dienoyl-CoA reductase-like NADH-dependent reductase (Old Yellow Enzyme family)
LLEAMVGAWSAERVGVRFSPSGTLYGMHDCDKRDLRYAVKALDAVGLAYLHLTEPNANVLKAGGDRTCRRNLPANDQIPLIITSTKPRATQ